MLICIDLSALYFAIRDLSITINYESLLTLLKERFGSSCEIHAFTIANSKNVSQQKFLDKLKSLGVILHVYPSTTPPNFTSEICTFTALSSSKEVVIVSNDWGLIRPFDILRDSGRDLTLSFFSEKLMGGWAPRVVSNSVKFFDLSSDEVKHKISE
tara:strand:+ start:3839 stop:4306 length:468 start_codon:yes stop_codon:yes gene_type:complete